MKNTIVKITILCLCCFVYNAVAQSRFMADNKIKFHPEKKVNSLNIDTTIIINEGRSAETESYSYHDGTTTLYIGVRYMPTFTSLSFHKTEEGPLETTMVLGHGFGGLIGANLSEHVALQAEFIYTILA